MLRTFTVPTQYYNRCRLSFTIYKSELSGKIKICILDAGKRFNGRDTRSPQGSQDKV